MVTLTFELWTQDQYGLFSLHAMNMSAEFDEDIYNGLLSIMFKRSRCDTPKDNTGWIVRNKTTEVLLYPL